MLQMIKERTNVAGSSIDAGPLWAEAFDPEEPLATPSGLAAAGSWRLVIGLLCRAWRGARPIAAQKRQVART